jgi:Transcription-silencing protein, cryptic loci regulator Clr2/Transcription-silencing protein Clr2
MFSAGPNYVLKSWPDGYRLYDHQKGPEDNPRHDLYLFGTSSRLSIPYIDHLFSITGPPRIRFRSTNEFIPHVIWLLQDPSKKNPCQCKYCTKKPQKEITASMPGILRSTPGTHSSSPSRPRPPREKGKGTRQTAMRAQERIREPKVYAAVQKAPIPLARSPNVSKRETALPERCKDLRAVHSLTEMKMRRWFRTGELVWCALTHPLVGPGDGVVIRFWPGLVDETRLKSKSIPRESASPGSSHPEKQVVHQTGNHGDVVFEDRSSPEWSIEQSTMYKIQLLAVTHSYVVPDDHVLPYQAHVPPNELIAGLQAFPSQNLDFSQDKLSNFNPCSEIQSDFTEAVAPYAMAVQIGSALSGYWNLTDEWAFEYTMPRPSMPPTVSSTSTSLSAALEAASLHNSQINALVNGSVSNGPTSQYYSVSAPTSGMSTSDLQQLSSRMVGKPPPPTRPAEPPKQYTQIRFQGLWWGAERIWVDEFIRLKVPRRCLAPKGAESIFPPSGPGKSAREMWLASGRDLSEIGAGARGVFMRLTALFVVDALQPDGFTKKECRASGMLYELADIDWEDPEAPENDSSAPVVNSVNPASQASQAVKNSSSRISSQHATSSKIPLNANPSKSQIQNPRSPSPNDQLSHPVETKFQLPQAPDGYRFRPILPKGYEAVISLSLVSGRYYPNVLAHPLLEPTLRDAISNPLECGGLLESNNLWALEGLSAGYYNSVDPTVYKTSRPKMVEDADRTAARELEEHKKDRLKELERDSMELDDHDHDVTEPEQMYPDSMDVDNVA